MSKIFSMILAATLILAAWGEPAYSQSLSDRIRAVRAKQVEAERRPADPKIAILQTLLYTRMTVVFEETPVRDVFDYVGTALGIKLVARFNDDRAGHGIDPETPITLEREDALALDVLNEVLEQCSVTEESTWQLRRDFLEVGTKERLGVRAAHELRVYPIGELLFEPPRFDDAPPMGFSYGHPGWIGPHGQDRAWLDPYGYGSGRTGSIGGASVQLGGGSGNSEDDRRRRAGELIDMITMTVEPDAWSRNGGDWATVDYRGGALVVRAPDFVQRQIGGYPRVPPPKRKPAAAPGTGSP